ncbi:MAG: hypothetical protein WDN08_05965 [Rhizomicrobium sp.]
MSSSGSRKLFTFVGWSTSSKPLVSSDSVSRSGLASATATTWRATTVVELRSSPSLPPVAATGLTPVSSA